MVEAILTEATLRRDYLPPAAPVETLYIGGGTPSILSPALLSRLIPTLIAFYQINPDKAEITLEANPDDLTPDKLKHIRALGVNRLSIGVQSFNDSHLRQLNRAHSRERAITCVEDAANLGMRLSLDLIYGIQGMTEREWQDNLLMIESLRPQHLSCYALTVEPKTLLAAQIKAGKQPKPRDAEAAKHFEMLREWCRHSGYTGYEISNYALPGEYSRHNSAYWEGKPYIGLGPSAHSFDGSRRQNNIANNARYLAAIERKEIPAQVEILSAADRLNEYIMTALRTQRGAALTTLRSLSGEEFRHSLQQDIESALKSGNLQEVEGHLIIPEQRLFFADGIAAALFQLEE